MISAIIYALENGVKYVRNHPQILFVLFLLIILPASFLYVSNTFLNVAKENTDTLRYQSIGLLNDAFATLAVETDMNAEVMQRQIESVSELNGYIEKFRVVESKEGKLITVAALAEDKIGTVVETDEKKLYEMSFAEPTGITFPFNVDNKHYLQSFRAVKQNDALLGYIFIETNETALLNVFKERQKLAYINMFILFAFLFVLAIWLIKITNYQYLYREVKEANKMKDLFTNMIAHELRAPLTAIRGYANMSAEETDKPVVEKYSERIQLSSERLLNIINDLLDVARIQSGKLAVDLKPTGVSDVIQAVLDELRISASEKSIELVFSGNDIDATAMADEKRLHQVLTNLVSNSIKYTKEGTITVELKDKKDSLEIRVEDTGMGISAEDQKKLFAPFFRVKNDDVSAITGTGLGMWVTKQMTELMGAKIGVESIKGVGTHVVIELPKKARK